MRKLPYPEYSVPHAKAMEALLARFVGRVSNTLYTDGKKYFPRELIILTEDDKRCLADLCHESMKVL